MTEFTNLETHILYKIINNCKMNMELIDNYIFEINERRYGLNIAINTIKSTYESAVVLEILARGLRDTLLKKKKIEIIKEKINVN